MLEHQLALTTIQTTLQLCNNVLETFDNNMKILELLSHCTHKPKSVVTFYMIKCEVELIIVTVTKLRRNTNILICTRTIKCIHI